jgi:hypothetical protein
MTVFKFSDNEKAAILSEVGKSGRTNRVGVYDNLGVFYVNQLELLDPIIYKPLTSVSWSRDIKLRTDLTNGIEQVSYKTKNWGRGGSMVDAQTVANGRGLPWVGVKSNGAQEITETYDKFVTQIYKLDYSISYEDDELERAAKANVNLDSEKYEDIQEASQMDVDQVTYIGDSFIGFKGLLNSAGVSASNVTGAVWASKTADQIVADVAEAFKACWTASGFAVMPTVLLLPPEQYIDISFRKVSDAGNMTILEYIKVRVVSVTGLGSASLDIFPVKWLSGRGASATNRMMLYSNESNYVRLPHLPMRGYPPIRTSKGMHRAYEQSIGGVEFIRPQTAIYRDGI